MQNCRSQPVRFSPLSAPPKLRVATTIIERRLSQMRQSSFTFSHLFEVLKKLFATHYHAAILLRISFIYFNTPFYLLQQMRLMLGADKPPRSYSLEPVPLIRAGAHGRLCFDISRRTGQPMRAQKYVVRRIFYYMPSQACHEPFSSGALFIRRPRASSYRRRVE